MYKTFLVTLIFLLPAGAVVSLDRPLVPDEEYAIASLREPQNEKMMAIIETCGPLVPITLAEVIKNTIALRTQIDIQIEDVGIQSGIVEERQGPFDWLVESQYSYRDLKDIYLDTVQTNLDGRDTLASLRGSKKLRNGTQFSVRFDAESVKNPTFHPLTPKYTMGTITFSVIQPILKRFIYGEDAVSELASKYELKAVYYDALHNISDLIRQSLISYWDVVHAQQTVLALKESVKSFEKLAYQTKRLIEEDQIAKAEINQPLAQLSAEQINLKVAEQLLYTAVQNLKFSAGMTDACYISDVLLYAMDPFPEIEQEMDICKTMKILNRMARERRLDKKAEEIRIKEFAILVKGAKNRKLPQLDLFYEQSQTQFKRNKKANHLYSSYNFSDPQNDKMVGVSFSYPLGNHESGGIYRRQKAVWRRQILTVDELSQQIAVQVMDSWRNHINIQQELVKAKDAVSKFQQLVEDEHKRLSEGLGSLFNLVDFQTRLTRAKIREIDIERNFGQNLANLHFFTGGLLKPSSNLCKIQVEDVTAMPFIECCQ